MGICKATLAVDGLEIRLTSWYGQYPITYSGLYIPGGAGFFPSTVVSNLEVQDQIKNGL